MKSVSKLCCNCMSRVSVCPVDAIEIKETNGFKKAYINEKKCINCGLCQQICSCVGLNRSLQNNHVCATVQVREITDCNRLENSEAQLC